MSLPAHETTLHSIMGTMQKEPDISQAFGDPEADARLESTLSAVTNLDDLVEVLADLIGTSITITPTVDDLIDHADHVCQLTWSGNHVAAGLDHYPNTAGVAKDPEADRKFYEATLAAGIWSSRNYPPPPHHYRKGIELPYMLPNLTVALKVRGYSDADVQKILGLNWIRVFKIHGL